MERLKVRIAQRWSAMGLAARMWWGALTTVGVAAVMVLATTILSEGPGISDVQASATVPRTAMPSMSSRGQSTTRSVGSTSPSQSMPPMASGDPSTEPGGAMPTMKSSSGTTSSAGTMPPMTTTPIGSSTSMPGSTECPEPVPPQCRACLVLGDGTSGSGNGNAISLATNSPAGPITWPLTMGSMGAGMQMVTPNCTTPPTATQQQAAVTLVNQTVSAVSRYQSLANARADGYVPITPTGQPVVHYAKPSYINDGNLLDPDAIESLVYANTPHGVRFSSQQCISWLPIKSVPPPPCPGVV